jgi:inorganic pyrophosphatase
MRVNTVEVFVEIPKGSRNKYEYDHEAHVLRLDRRLFTATAYPGDYGFVQDTLGDDGDPLDALVLVDDPSFPGCVITARVLGVFQMEDEAGGDAKLICVVDNDPLWQSVHDLDELPPSLLNEIEHFFEVYKMLEPHKKTTAIGYAGRDVAMREVETARERFGSTG